MMFKVKERQHQLSDAPDAQGTTLTINNSDSSVESLRDAETCDAIEVWHQPSDELAMQGTTLSVKDSDRSRDCIRDTERCDASDGQHQQSKCLQYRVPL